MKPQLTLRELLQGVTDQPIAAVPVSGVACHSKQVRPGDCFVAIVGETSDGHDFIHEAITRGARAIVAQEFPNWQTRACPCVRVSDTRAALAKIASRFYGDPGRKLRLIGVTGTNGKTTTSYLIKTILETAGAHSGLLGTISYQIGARSLPSTNTTPGSLELQRYFSQMAGSRLGWCAMEVSSHALAQERLCGLALEAAVFLNLGLDHLEYHKTRENYAAAKRKIFEYLKPQGLAVLNADDEFGRCLAETLPNRSVVTFGMDHPSSVRATRLQCTWGGIKGQLETPWGLLPFESPLLGRHNVWNIAAAAATLLALGINRKAIAEGLSVLEEIPGRIEQVPNDCGLRILIDYAHTTDALRLVLLSIRELCRRRLIVVFGCGGNRDKAKRPAMGRMASLLADHVILTSDNPRGENPTDIIHQIKSGFVMGFRAFDVMPDREQAIVKALSMALPDDTVLIAGKGHEAYQLFDNVSVPFRDRDIIERWAGSHHNLALA